MMAVLCEARLKTGFFNSAHGMAASAAVSSTACLPAMSNARFKSRIGWLKRLAGRRETTTRGRCGDVIVLHIQQIGCLLAQRRIGMRMNVKARHVRTRGNA